MLEYRKLNNAASYIWRKWKVRQYILDSKRNAYFSYLVKCLNWGLNTDLLICKVSLMYWTCVLSNASQMDGAIWIMIIKGCNSGHNKITHNKGDFQDGVCLKPLNGFEWKSLCVTIMTYRLLMKFKFSNILYGGLLWPSYTIRQLTRSVFNTGKKGSKQLFYTVLLDTILLDINHTVPDNLTPQGSSGFQYQCKKTKKWTFSD